MDKWVLTRKYIMCKIKSLLLKQSFSQGYILILVWSIPYGPYDMHETKFYSFNEFFRFMGHQPLLVREYVVSIRDGPKVLENY